MSVLILNSAYSPVNIVSNHDAARKLVVSYDWVEKKLTTAFPTEYFKWLTLEDELPDRKDIITIRTPSKILAFNNIIVETTAPYRRLLQPTLTYNYILMRDNRTCVYCGEYANTVDHVIPKSKGGEDSWENLVAACRDCNAKKANKVLDDFRPDLTDRIHDVARMPKSKEALFASYLHPEWREYIFY